MPLTFLAPAFLLGLAALAIPIIVHLRQRQRHDALEFPSLMFLRQVPYKETRRRRIRHWLLFALRSFALILLVAAFAHPFFEREGGGANPLAMAREVVVLLDRSYSMGYGDRWARALAAARGTIDGLGEDDRATVVFFDQGAAAANVATSDRVRLRSIVDAAHVGSGTTRYGPAIKLAQGILAASDRPRREVVLITDFQSIGWDGAAGLRLPAGTELRPVLIGDSATSNVAVAAVTFRRQYVSERERVTATARLTNTGHTPVKKLPVVLELDGRKLETKPVDIAPDNSATVTFAPFTLGSGVVRGIVRAGTDALPVDNVFNFALSQGQAVSVLLVNGGGNDTPLYVERALGIGESPSFKVDTRGAGALRASDLAGRSVVILNDVPFPGGASGRRLRSFIEGGGGLIIALGDRAGEGGWGAGADVLPGTPGAIVDRSESGGGAIGYVDYAHPVFELFRGPRSGDVSAARFFRYRPLQLEDRTGVLARFDDGAPALVERHLGAGRVLVWASTLDTYWNDLPLHPVFLPFTHQLVKQAGSYAERRPWFTAGQVLDVASADTAASAADTMAAEGTDGRDLIAIAPSGERVAVGPSGLLRLDEQGFYAVHDARGGDEGDLVVAVNLDLKESDLSMLDPRELASAVEPRGDEPALVAGSIPVEDRERRQALWWYLLIAAFVLLAAETLVSNRLSRRRRAPA